jgi:NitT/TauT family transport system permease protein
MARIRWLDWALDLPINALYATPLVAVVPLLVLWFGIYLKAKIIVVFLFAVFPVLINTYQGVRECDKNMLEVAHSFRSSEWRVWRDVLLPFAVPYIIAGIRLAIGRGLIGMIIAEFYTTISGLGFMITRYANVFEMDKTFVPVIVLMVLGVSLTSLLKWFGRRIAPWSAANR